MRKLGLVLLVVWAVVFVLGAVGQLFDVGSLQALDPKRLFLR